MSDFLKGYNWKLELLIVFSAISILTFFGPFGTFIDIWFAQRLLFWAIAVLGCGAIFWAIFFLSIQLPKFKNSAPWSQQVIIVFLTAFPGSIHIYYLNVVFRDIAFPMDKLPWLWFTVFFIGMIASAAHFYSLPNKFTSPDKALKVDKQPIDTAKLTNKNIQIFLNRLPPELGQDLISLSSHDHYISVNTAKGSAMIYMNFSDAIGELAAYPGTQIHRSNWVSFSAINGLEKEGRKNFVKLSNGKKLRISEKYKSVLE